jgi:hypothetical protein
MSFKIGDEVFHKIMNRKGVVNDLISDKLIEVKYDGDLYLWTISNVDNLEKVASHEDPYGWIQVHYDDWDRSPRDTPPPIPKCRCESRDLFHYGCQCGHFKAEG